MPKPITLADIDLDGTDFIPCTRRRFRWVALWLKEQLRTPRLVVEVRRLAEECGISPKMLERVRQHCQVSSMNPSGQSHHWFWVWPDEHPRRGGTHGNGEARRPDYAGDGI
jgi:hypothetical protein